jgi:hypothetical protein
MLVLGQVLKGRYRIERLFGETGMGMVALAQHEQQGTPVAIKCLRPEFSHDQAMVAAFLREARAAIRLQGDQRCRVSETGTLENGAPYIVMEFVDGLDQRELARTEGRLAHDMVVDFILRACAAVARTEESTRAAMDDTAAAQPRPADDQVPTMVQFARTARIRARAGHRSWWWSVALGVMIALILIGAGFLGRFLGRDDQDGNHRQTADTPASDSVVSGPAEIKPDTSTVEPPSAPYVEWTPSAPPPEWTPAGQAMVGDPMRSSASPGRTSGKSSRGKSSRRRPRAERKAEKSESEVKPVDKIYEWTR